MARRVGIHPPSLYVRLRPGIDYSAIELKSLKEIYHRIHHSFTCRASVRTTGQRPRVRIVHAERFAAMPLRYNRDLLLKLDSCSNADLTP